MPERIQLRRTKGWRKPKGAVVVARPTKWGNPFAIGKTVYPVEGYPLDEHHIRTRQDSVEAFRRMLASGDRSYPSDTEIREQLRGCDLACWCPLDQPCHADVLLQLANRED